MFGMTNPNDPLSLRYGMASEGRRKPECSNDERDVRMPAHGGQTVRALADLEALLV
jgi:hypothetical protein